MSAAIQSVSMRAGAPGFERPARGFSNSGFRNPSRFDAAGARSPGDADRAHPVGPAN
jgi:hypothetical protein